MSYAVKYKTIVSGSPCSVTLRGIFDDGKYFGDVVVYDHHFNFSIDGYFCDSIIKSIFNSITYLKSINPIETDVSVDCWIAEFPIQSRKVFFYHYDNYEYEKETKHYYDILINVLKSEFDVLIQNKIHEQRILNVDGKP